MKEIIKHIFSKKSLQIRFVTFIWVLLCSWYWTGDAIKSSGLAISVLIGSMIIQGVFEWLYDDDLRNWYPFIICFWKVCFLDILKNFRWVSQFSCWIHLKSKLLKGACVWGVYNKQPLKETVVMPAANILFAKRE